MLAFSYKLHFASGEIKDLDVQITESGPTALVLRLSGAFSYEQKLEGMDGVHSMCLVVAALKEYFTRRAAQGTVLMFDDKVPPKADLLHEAWTVD